MSLAQHAGRPPVGSIPNLPPNLSQARFVADTRLVGGCYDLAGLEIESPRVCSALLRSLACEAQLRNIFDQYSQPENRITHALLTVMNEDRKLLGAFLRELVKVDAPTDAGNLSISEQQFPG